MLSVAGWFAYAAAMTALCAAIWRDARRSDARDELEARRRRWEH